MIVNQSINRSIHHTLNTSINQSSGLEHSHVLSLLWHCWFLSVTQTSSTLLTRYSLDDLNSVRAIDLWVPFCFFQETLRGTVQPRAIWPTAASFPRTLTRTAHDAAMMWWWRTVPLPTFDWWTNWCQNQVPAPSTCHPVRSWTFPMPRTSISQSECQPSFLPERSTARVRHAIGPRKDHCSWYVTNFSTFF